MMPNTSHRNKQASSYFVESEEESAFSNSKADNYETSSVLKSHVDIILRNRNDATVQFPANARILWDRQGVSMPFSMIAANVLPPLVLTASDAKVLAKTAIEFSNKTDIVPLQQLCSFVHISRSASGHQSNLAAWRRLDHYLICFANADPHLSAVSLNLPFSFIAINDCAMSSMKENIINSIISSKELSLKQFMRIRSTSSRQQNNSVRFTFEALVPDISFQVMMINPVPILKTALSMYLSSTSAQPEQQSAALATGFLTLNQTRKLVFLLESDASISTTPLVGCWIKFNDRILPDDVDPFVAAHHPICWAAAVRFLLSHRIGQRAFVAHETFLLVIMVSENVHFFEIIKQANSNQRSPLDDSYPFDFLQLDYTTTLSDDSNLEVNQRRQESSGGVICAFKRSNVTNAQRQPSPPQQQLPRSYGQHPALSSPSSSTLTDPSSGKGIEEQKSILLSPRQHIRDQTQPTSSFLLEQSEEFPRPRVGLRIQKEPPSPIRAAFTSNTHVNYSMESAPGAFSALQTATKSEFDSYHSQTAVRHSLPVDYFYEHPSRLRHSMDGPSNVNQQQHQAEYSFPASVISAQQKQIEALRNEVEQLKQLVQSLTQSSTVNQQTVENTTESLGLLAPYNNVPEPSWMMESSLVISKRSSMLPPPPIDDLIPIREHASRDYSILYEDHLDHVELGSFVAPTASVPNDDVYRNDENYAEKSDSTNETTHNEGSSNAASPELLIVSSHSQDNAATLPKDIELNIDLPVLPTVAKISTSPIRHYHTTEVMDDVGVFQESESIIQIQAKYLSTKGKS